MSNLLTCLKKSLPQIPFYSNPILLSTKMKLVVFFAFLLMFSLCSSGLKEDLGVTHIDQYSSGKVKESIENLMDYPEPGPNEPGRRYPGRPHGPHPPRRMMKKKNP
ncbi:hypothetical protein ISN44_As10g017450 [Arabidopsis suecica]|uniref:Uncharacterized protein n=1 Tax=Arabidopsis suecica TaxID=45249 RepID=A0A8T1ZVW7_ARASU|nr:hypothetical protein ISN44_As10g017450 [Arabidopsis suecica]